MNWSTRTLRTSLEWEIHGTWTTQTSSQQIVHHRMALLLPLLTTRKMFCTKMNQIFHFQIHPHCRHSLLKYHINNGALNWKCLVNYQSLMVHKSGNCPQAISSHLHQTQSLIPIPNSLILSSRLTMRFCRTKLRVSPKSLMLSQRQLFQMVATTPRPTQRQCNEQMPTCGMRLCQRNSIPFGIWELFRLLNHYHLEPRLLTQN